MMPLGKAPGAQFEISVDGKLRSYRDRKAVAIEAAEHLKRSKQRGHGQGFGERGSDCRGVQA
jgi:hypothetical protein